MRDHKYTRDPQSVQGSWATADLQPCCSCLPLRSVNAPPVDAECTDKQPSGSEALVLEYWFVQYKLFTVNLPGAALCQRGALVCKIYLNSYPTAWCIPKAWRATLSISLGPNDHHVTFSGSRHSLFKILTCVQHYKGSDLSCGQYLFVMLHLQSLQLTSLCAFSLTLVLCLMKLSHKNKHMRAA